jgi:hypothetical protein
MALWDMIRTAATGRWLSEEEHLQGIEDGVNSLKARGMLPQGHPPREQPGATYDTGHQVESVLSGDHGNWTTYITHHGDPEINRAVAIEHGDLGGDHSRLGDALHSALRHPEVMQSMRELMQHGDAKEPRWFREFNFS